MKNVEQGKLFARERLRLLLDDGSLVEDAALASARDPELPADGVVTGMGTIDGRPVCVMATDSTVRAGSWGKRTVEKILRIQEVAARERLPLFYLVDSAGARIADQIEMFPGRRGAGKIFHQEVHLSGVVPQICLLFGPSAAGGAYIPAFCDLVFMVEGNASRYLGSPRMAETVIGEKATLEEMGGARLHCSVSGRGDVLCQTEEEAIAEARRWFAFMPRSFRELPPAAPARPPRVDPARIPEIVPADQNRPFDVMQLVEALVDEGSFFEVKKLFAGELVTGLGRIEGRAVGIAANQPKVKGGVLFADSADKAARFIWLCDAFNVPLLYLSDVPGFMIGTRVERAGIIRSGARMISAISEASVPRLCVVVRKAYGAGLYAMDGPGFRPSATLALPQAMMAVMGPEAAVNAVFHGKVMEKPEAGRAAYVQQLREECQEDLDIEKLASELVVDAVVPGKQLRDEIARRFRFYAAGYEPPGTRKRVVPPV